MHHDKFSTQMIVSTLLDIVYKIIDIYLFLVSNLIKSTAEQWLVIHKKKLEKRH